MKKDLQQCPICGNTINKQLVTQFEESIKNDLQAELSRRENELKQKKKEFSETKNLLEREKEEFDQLVKAQVHMQMLSKEDILKKAIRKEIDEEKALQLEELEKELIKKSGQLQEMNKNKAQLEILRRELEEAEARITLDKENEFSERLEAARQLIKEQEQKASFLKLKEKEHIIDSLKVKLDEAKNKAEQGSMQVQGEVQELSLENMLRNLHPTDEILEVPKGKRGADCLQVVKTVQGAEIGKILYESKNTKNFSDTYIEKIKNDNLVAKADIMIIVTRVMPSDIETDFGIKEGVWICKYDSNSIQNITLALRFGLLKLQAVAITQHGKKSKMELLYNYLTSEEFKNVFEAILSGFKTIQDQHHDEKLKLQNLWRQREKTLEQILSNTVNFYGSIRGISSNIPDINMLDFPKAS